MIIAGANKFSLDGLVAIETPCTVGRQLNALGVCVNLDACVTTPCAGNASCFDFPPPAPGTSAGRRCVCDAGFSGPNCTAIDACIDYPCSGANEFCVDLPAPAGNSQLGRTCNCTTGFMMNASRQCANADACIGAPCSPNADCTDLPPPAPYNTTAGRTCRCRPPFLGNGNTCDCPAGRMLSSNGSACVELDACHTAPCDPNAICRDIVNGPRTAAGRTCTCPQPQYFGDGEITGTGCNCTAGYHMVNGTCVNIDACQTPGAAPCIGQNVVCYDLPPPAGILGRQCRCDAGYQQVGLNPQCTPIDACITTPCPFGTACTDLPPPAPANASGRVCQCPPGMEEGIGPDGRNGCVDVNSCVGVTLSCPESQTCVDFPAPAMGYECGCAAGTAPSSTTGLCVPVVACTAAPCVGDNTACTNLPAFNGTFANSRTCTCQTGYDGYGTIAGCVDIDACTTSPCDANAVCADHPPPDGADRTGRSCVCRAGFTGNGEVCVGSAASSGASSSSDDDMSTSTLIFVVLLAALVIAVVVVGVMVTKRGSNGNASRANRPRAPKGAMQGSIAFENPVYAPNNDSAAPEDTSGGGYIDVTAPQHYGGFQEDDSDENM